MTNAVESNTYIILLPYLFDHRPFNILALTSTYSLRKKNSYVCVLILLSINLMLITDFGKLLFVSSLLQMLDSLR